MTGISIRATLTLTCALLLGVPSLAVAAEVRVPRTIGFASTATVRAAIKDECDLQRLVPAAIADASPIAELVDGNGNLKLEITGVHAPGGWVFSGPKWLEVSGRLSRDGKYYTFRAKRFSAFDPIGGVCSILAKCARAIGEDVATWLQSPVGKAVLGDAQ